MIQLLILQVNLAAKTSQTMANLTALVQTYSVLAVALAAGMSSARMPCHSLCVPN